ncbi:hypothetical protein SDC9_61448 [bioreactor metagenome]|uniref:Uncharacterized protein n=1 Tax=bioreactor metagenome TaxID=1076179 RepID=A0A644XFT4_9ZZZZ
MRALEAHFLVVFIAIFQGQGFQLGSRQVGLRGKIQLQNFITGGNAFFLQIVFEGCHIPCPHTKHVERFQLVHMGAFGAFMLQCALQGKAFAFKAHTTPKKLDNLRAFARAHVQ